VMDDESGDDNTLGKYWHRIFFALPNSSGIRTVCVKIFDKNSTGF